ncbi:chorismate mutase [Saccharospirillum salsuginis]|uniref:chorismate mutase n=1 Tax=Saccharospirillum salsuginis TaxID=418750 RepID=A0A918KB44_9GAMM|nr:chorismate mutase [Saccharospirillum salsuginis]GGX57514.1 hypothetical protein GCM10007392_26360 [Saccharospirillum salsuginis]
MLNLDDVRKSIDEIDSNLIQLLAKRYSICREVAHYKKTNGIPMMQPNRVEEVKGRCARMAEEQSLSGDFARQLYTLIINEACRIEDVIIDGE